MQNALGLVKAQETDSASRPNIPHRRERAHPLISLQQQLGNQSVQRILGSDMLQTKLEVSRSGDVYEEEANQVAGLLPEPVSSGVSRFGDVSTRQQSPSGTPPGPSLIEQLGGHLRTGPPIDVMLQAFGARAATIGRDVYVRQDIAGSAALESRETFAHEAVHLLQQRNAEGAPESGPSHGVAEREAQAAAKDLMAGRVPIVRFRSARPAVHLQLDPDADFQPGIVSGSFADLQASAQWVDTDIINYELSEKEPWTFTILYKNGSILVVPLSTMWTTPLHGATMTLVRRHRQTGRLIPFQISQDDPRIRDPSLSAKAGMETIMKVVPPRFDPNLTPRISSFLNEAQMRYLAIHVLEIIKLQLMNPVLLGFGPGATAEGAEAGALSRLALRRGATALAEEAGGIGESLLAQVSKLGGSKLQQYLEFARRLSEVPELTAQAKADLLEGFAGRFGLDVGGQAAKEGGRILLVAKDGKTAFQIAADGTITFGKFSVQTLDVVNPTVIRPL